MALSQGSSFNEKFFPEFYKPENLIHFIKPIIEYKYQNKEVNFYYNSYEYFHS